MLSTPFSSLEKEAELSLWMEMEMWQSALGNRKLSSILSAWGHPKAVYSMRMRNMKRRERNHMETKVRPKRNNRGHKTGAPPMWTVTPKMKNQKREWMTSVVHFYLPLCIYVFNKWYPLLKIFLNSLLNNRNNWPTLFFVYVMTTFIDQHDKFMEEIKMGNTRDAFQILQKYPKIAVSNIHVYNFCWSIITMTRRILIFISWMTTFQL